jgi:hemerythrin-like domain-containing protein
MKKAKKSVKKTVAKNSIARKAASGKNKARKVVSKMANKLSGAPGDIIQLILRDHKPLKELIEVLKDSEVSVSVKRPAFKKFAPLLLGHAQPEEKSLYVYMKEEDKNLRVEGYEGDTEHAIASQLVDEIEATTNTDEWMAKVKVLAELVDHHIMEEENDMLPDIRMAFDEPTRLQIGDEYTRLREDFESIPPQPVYRPEEENEIRPQ